MKLISILQKVITEKVFQASSLSSASDDLLEFISNSGVNDKDKNKMINEIQKQKSLVSLQRYCANALLKFEGLSSQMSKRDELTDDTGPL